MIEPRTIDFIEDSDQIIQLYGGLSADQKYKVIKDNQQSYLVRIFSLEELENKKVEFQLLNQLKQLQVKSPTPIEIGTIPTSSLGYSIVSFIDGISGEKVIHQYSKKEQHQVGLEAGQELRKMHTLQAPAEVPSWDEQKYAKHQRYMKAYTKGSVHIKQDQLLSQYIESQVYLMKGRPNLFQHDDYHLNNLIINESKFAGVIDFERHDWGDPVHEFLKIGLFTRHYSTSFSAGLVQGYHNEEHPDEAFWKLYGLYTAMAIFSSIVWIMKVMREQLDDMLKRIEIILVDHDQFKRLIPLWYEEGMNF